MNVHDDDNHTHVNRVAVMDISSDTIMTMINMLLGAARHTVWASLLLLSTGLLPAAPAWSGTPAWDSPMDMNQRAVWGEVAAEDLRWTEFPPDTNANAVILSDYGEVTFHGDFEIRKIRHTRIKILNEAGYSRGDVGFSYHSADNLQRLRRVEAATYTLDDSGEVQRHPLPQSAITEDDVTSRYTLVRFSMPALEPGAVIEYRYEITSRNPYFLSDWTFQSSEPTLWSEFEAQIPAVLGYVQVSQFFQHLEIRESEAVQRILELSRPDIAGTTHRWAMKNVPALRDEPYMTSRSDYLNRIRFQLSEFLLPGIGRRPVLHDWDTVADELRRHSDFGRQIGTNRAMRQQVSEITSGLDDPEEIIQAVHNYVRDHIHWNEEYGIMADNGVRSTFRDQTGNGSDINLLLISLLREAGIDAHPVIIRLRSSGRVIDLYPMIGQFNHTLALAATGDQVYILDATRENLEWNLLPFGALAERGLLIRRNPEWITFGAFSPSHRRAFAQARVCGESGTLSGTIQSRHSGYAGYYSRRSVSRSSEEEFLRTVYLEHFDDPEINNQDFTDLDNPDAPLVFRFDFENARSGYEVDGRIYLSPHILYRIDDNPFTLEDRHFPVDFGIPRIWNFTLHLEIPENYEVVEAPENMSITFDRHGQYRHITERHGNLFLLSSEFNFPSTRVEPEDYKQLQTFYELIAESHSEMIVLQRIDSPGEFPVQLEEGPAHPEETPAHPEVGPGQPGEDPDQPEKTPMQQGETPVEP